MKRTIVTALFASFIGFAIHPAFSEEPGVLVLIGKPLPAPTMKLCKQVLEQGHIIKTDLNGGLHISFDGLYFLIQVDEKEIRCQMYRHVAK